MFFLRSLVMIQYLRDREVVCSASDYQGLKLESCVWRAVSSHPSYHPQEVLLAQFSLYVHTNGLLLLVIVSVKSIVFYESSMVLYPPPPSPQPLIQWHRSSHDEIIRSTSSFSSYLNYGVVEYHNWVYLFN